MVKSELQVTARERSGKGVARSLRRQGLIPAVVYGKGAEPCGIAVDPKALKKAMATEAGLNTLLTLTGDGAFSGKVVLLKETQIDSIRRNLTHADFQIVDLKKKTHVMVPVHPIGKSAGEKLGGTLQLIRHEIEVICLPTAIPKAIEIDVTAMNVGDVLHVNDITPPAGTTLVHDVNFTVITIAARTVEKETEEGDEESDVAEDTE